MRWTRIPIECCLGFCLLVTGGAIVTPWSVAILAAQTHPCDQAVPATVTIQSGAPHKVQLCARASDNVEALLAVVDQTPFDLVPLVAKTPTPSATGMTLYESGAFVQVAKGQHSLTVRLYNKNQLTGQMQLGDASVPFVFTAADDTPPAAAPVVIGVVK